MTTPTDAPFVLTAHDAGVATLTLNRGERFNPLSAGMIDALERAIDALAAAPHVRVVVLAAAGRGFCAGHDLKELRAHSGAAGWQRELFASCARMMLKLTRLPVPVIARVHGLATAAGCQLVSMCDLAIASADAKFALPGVNVGVFCSTPVVGVLRNVGRKRAMQLLLSGQPIDAQTASEWGLINEAVPGEALDARVAQLAQEIAARSARVIAIGKQAFYGQADLGIEAAYTLASEAMTENLGTHDADEGMDAFLGKRTPEWRDR